MRVSEARPKVLLFANTAWYLFNFRLELINALSSEGFDVVLVSPPDDYGPRLLRLGLRWVPVPMKRKSLNPLREIRLLVRLVQLYRAERPDLAHHFTVKCVVYGSIAAVFAGVRGRMNAVAGMGYVFSGSSWKARALRPIVSVLMRLAVDDPAARLILQNPEDESTFVRAGIVPPGRVRLIPSSGVDTERFHPSGCSPLVQSPARALLAARLLWQKGLQEFVDSAQLLGRRFVPVTCVLAGMPDAGNPNSVDAATLDSWRRDGILEIVGHVEDMVAELSRTDIVVLPTYYGEGVPRSLIEAAACGLPIVATDHPGCREVVIDGETGLLVPVRDPVALANAIERLIDDPEYARSLGRAARERAVSLFDERIVIRDTLNVYRELLADVG